MKVLVTGANGLTGGHLAMRLRNSGHEVRALVRPSADVSKLTAMGAEVVTGQLSDLADVRRAANGCAQIYHIAAVFRTAGHADSHYFDINVGGTTNVLEAAQAEGCERVIHCSTGGVHGHVADPPADENYRFSAADVYQESKLQAERVVQAAIAKGQRAVIFRPAAIYGEGDTRFLKLYRSIQKRRFVMIGPGETRLHMVHLDDLCEGIELCGSQESAVGEVFLIAGPDAPTLNELVNLIAAALKVSPPALRIPVWPVYLAGWLTEMLCVPFGVEPPLHRRRVSFFTHHREWNIDKARRLLGYAPKVSAAAGVARTAAWYISEGLLPAPPRR